MPPAKSKIESLYRDDLAQIHIDGYGFHWEGAAPALLEWLSEFGLDRGLVVDLGCGGGQWLACLERNGYQTVGVDVSSSMIRCAKKVATKSKFICDSFAEADLPACDAVTSLGEPLNYLNSSRLMQKTIRNVYRALRPGGYFIFDVRHPATRPVDVINHNKMDRDWFCHARIEESGLQLTREITTFRRVGTDRFRRDEEVHRLKLASRKTMTEWLRAAGFRVKTKRSYGEYALLKRQSVFICRKVVS